MRSLKIFITLFSILLTLCLTMTPSIEVSAAPSTPPTTSPNVPSLPPTNRPPSLPPGNQCPVCEDCSCEPILGCPPMVCSCEEGEDPCPEGVLDPDCPCGQVKGCDGVCGSGKVISGCDNQCGSSKVPDECGNCGGDGSGCECLYVLQYTDFSPFLRDQAVGHNYLTPLDLNIEDQFNINNSDGIPSCLQNTLDAKCSCTPENYLTCSGADTSFLENILSPQVGFWGICQGRVSDIAQSLNLPTDTHQIPPLSNLIGTAPYWYLDAECNVKEVAEPVQVCGYASFSETPISLVIGDYSSLNENNTVVKFPLSPDANNPYTIWKASDAFPLLVYDPENTGEVKDAKQLFGSYAFGGKTEDLNDFNSDSFREPWEHGYEALALLDKNGDGKISGEELKGLKLWFDTNRDAKVDAGEIRELSSEGITSLYYQDSVQKLGSLDRVLSVGFEKEEEGKVVKGASVDWFAKSFSSMAEAITGLTADYHSMQKTSRTRLEDDSSSRQILENKIAEQTEAAKLDKDDDSKNLSGYWVWTMQQEGAENHPGLFVIGEDENKKIAIRSVSEGPLGKNEQGVRTAMLSLYGEGVIERLENGEGILSFEIKDPSSGTLVHTLGKVSPDGKLMGGTSEQSFEANYSGERVSAKASYSWVATKMMPEKK